MVKDRCPSSTPPRGLSDPVRKNLPLNFLPFPLTYDPLLIVRDRVYITYFPTRMFRHIYMYMCVSLYMYDVSVIKKTTK